jgi:hypothetical protein
MELAIYQSQVIDRIQADEIINRRREKLQIKNTPAEGVTQTGGVYFAWSDCLNCMKIGATRREDPHLRLRELSSYTTTSFSLVAWFPSAAPFSLENIAHKYFKEKRINTRGSGAGTEFFHISAGEVETWFHGLSEIPNAKKRKTEAEIILSANEKAAIKTERKSAFSIKNLIDEMGLKVEAAFVPAICKAVCRRYRVEHHLGEMFTRKRQTFFYNQDRECLRKMIENEFSEHQIRRLDEPLQVKEALKILPAPVTVEKQVERARITSFS